MESADLANEENFLKKVKDLGKMQFQTEIKGFFRNR